MSKHDAILAEIKRLDQLRSADQVATITALTAAEKAVAAALAASDKAVEKSELAQKGVNASQNEFRGTLRDQALTFMPRAETENLVRELRGLIAAEGDILTELRNANSRQQGALAVARFVGFGGLLAGLSAFVYTIVNRPL